MNTTIMLTSMRAQYVSKHQQIIRCPKFQKSPSSRRVLFFKPCAYKDREFEEFRDTERDPRYQRIDMSEEHAKESRLAFLTSISAGEGTIDLSEAALHIAAEDDALVSHSAVQFPVTAYRTRLQRLSEEFSRINLPSLREKHATDQEILDELLRFIYEYQKFTPPNFGRSNVPPQSVVDNPGVWEKPQLAYLHDVLVTKQGIPAAIGILISDILRRLLISGSIDFAAKIELADLRSPPTAKLIPGMKRDGAVSVVRATPMQTAGVPSPYTTPNSSTAHISVLNTCSTDALVELLSYLKRSYWPFSWDSYYGGFRGAAKSFLDGSADSAEAEAIARTARHRLERGIWTSPGGGDIRRALAAAERLVILRGDDMIEERLDAAILYCHMGRLKEAHVELKAYAAGLLARRKKMKSVGSGNGGGIGGKMIISLTPGEGIGVSTASTIGELPDSVLVDRLLTLLSRAVAIDEKMNGNVDGDVQALSLEEGLRRCQDRGKSARIAPLTW